MARRLNILLVEDDAEDALLFKRRCPPHAQVTHVGDAAAAFEQLYRGQTDVCFTDYLLGATSGLELIRSARGAGLRTPMVVITGQEIESLGENALLAGATDFVQKDELSAAVIERVSRWALIRRHVENRREDSFSKETLIQLLGTPPTLADASTAGTPGAMLRRVVYISQAQRIFTQQELLKLCSSFAAANARCQITGVLVLAGSCFLQVIEGDEHAIEVLLRRIQSDARHSDVSLIIDEPIRKRVFGQWNMGCVHLNVRYEMSANRWQNLLAELNQSLCEGADRRNDLGQLIRTLPEVLGRLSA